MTSATNEGKQYWVAIYLYRRIGQGPYWNVANEPHEGTVADWFRKQRQFDTQETKLLNLIPISKEEYEDYIKENLG